MSWFLELEEQLGLFCKIALCFLCVATAFSSAGDEPLGAHFGFVSSSRFFDDMEPDSARSPNRFPTTSNRPSAGGAQSVSVPCFYRMTTARTSLECSV